LNREIKKFVREFGIDETSSLYAEIVAACKRKRRCVNELCKKRLKLVDYLELNINAEDLEPANRFSESMRRLLGLWSDPRIELYCCGCFEPAASAGNANAKDEKLLERARSRRILRNFVIASLLFLGGMWMTLTFMAGGILLPLRIAGIVIGGLLYLAGVLVFFKERTEDDRENQEARRARLEPQATMT